MGRISKLYQVAEFFTNYTSEFLPSSRAHFCGLHIERNFQIFGIFIMMFAKTSSEKYIWTFGYRSLEVIKENPIISANMLNVYPSREAVIIAGSIEGASGGQPFHFSNF